MAVSFHLTSQVTHPSSAAQLSKKAPGP